MSLFNSNYFCTSDCINFTSLLYMIPLSISMGVTILVGQEIGAGTIWNAKQYSYLGIRFAVLFSFISIVILLAFREQIASIYTIDIDIVNSHSFLHSCSAIPIVRCSSSTCSRGIRGYKDVNMTFVMAIVSYWVLGLPIGYLMANYTDLGPYGYWIGLILVDNWCDYTNDSTIHIQKKNMSNLNPADS